MRVTYSNAAELAEALRRAAVAHGRHEEQTGQPDPDWPAWYARHMEREQTRADPDKPGPQDEPEADQGQLT